jgi:hypothetical protein
MGRVVAGGGLAIDAWKRADQRRRLVSFADYEPAESALCPAVRAAPSKVTPAGAKLFASPAPVGVLRHLRVKFGGAVQRRLSGS